MWYNAYVRTGRERRKLKLSQKILLVIGGRNTCISAEMISGTSDILFQGRLCPFSQSNDNAALTKRFIISLEWIFCNTNAPFLYQLKKDALSKDANSIWVLTLIVLNALKNI